MAASVFQEALGVSGRRRLTRRQRELAGFFGIA
jgi:hypothetical protein